MVSRLVVTVPQEKLEEVKKAVTNAVKSATVHMAIVIETDTNDDNDARALIAAMTAGASTAFKA